MVKKTFTSPASRNVNYFFTNWNLKLNDKKLTLRKKWLAGRGSSGKSIIRTRASLLLKLKYTKINYNLRYSKLGLIVSFKFIPFRNKLLSLVYFSNGSVSYFLATNLHKIFNYVYLNKSKRMKKIKLKNTFMMLFQIKKLSFVSCLEILPGKGSQYARSSGTKSKIIKIDKESHTILIQLPSKIKKIFSYYSFAALGNIALPENKKYLNSKAGYWRSFGLKPVVRGVAMNPVDHPHGGRTKSVKYPRTPWGKTTKFK